MNPKTISVLRHIEDIGIYHVKGRVKFDEDSADYYNVKVTQIR